jgi:hypothetical protein
MWILAAGRNSIEWIFKALHFFAKRRKEELYICSDCIARGVRRQINEELREPFFLRFETRKGISYAPPGNRQE